MARGDRPIAYVLLYVSLYGAFGVASPFWPKLFESRGLTPQQIGFVLAAAMVIRLAAGPLVGRLADILANLRFVLATCLVMAALAAAAYLSVHDFWPILLVALAQGAALAPTTSLADALTVNAARPSAAVKPFEYGRIRGSASAAFLLGTLAVGQLVSATDLTPVIWLNVGLLLAASGLTGFLSAIGTNRDKRRGSTLADVGGLFRLSSFRSIIVLSSLVYGSHALYDAFAVIRWSDAGLNVKVVSLLWAEAVAAEVVVFFLVGPWIVDRLGARAAAVLAAGAGIIRWSAMGFTNSAAMLSLLQPLHGLTFALLHLACMRVMAVTVPPGSAATAQAIYALGSGLMTAVLTTMSGSLYAAGTTGFLSMAGLCLVAIPFAWWGLDEQWRHDRARP